MNKLIEALANLRKRRKWNWSQNC